jgi:adenylate cyclase, class 2
MAYNNTEVEIKVKVTKSKFVQVVSFLEKSAKFNKLSHQVDTYFSPTPNSFLKPKYPFEWLSIRERGGKILLNYKHWYPEGAKNTTYCDEYETEVTDKKQLEIIFSAININKLITIDKNRSTYIYDNDIEVAMDEVKGLGYFIEAESLNNKGGTLKTFERLKKFIQSLGIKNISQIPGGYGAEMMRKKGLMKKYLQ